MEWLGTGTRKRLEEQFIRIIFDRDVDRMKEHFEICDRCGKKMRIHDSEILTDKKSNPETTRRIFLGYKTYPDETYFSYRSPSMSIHGLDLGDLCTECVTSASKLMTAWLLEEHK